MRNLEDNARGRVQPQLVVPEDAWGYFYLHFYIEYGA